MPPIPAPTSPTYLTPKEAGNHLNLSHRTLEKMRTDGGGPKFKKLGRRIRYTIADLDAWAESRSYDSTFDPAYLSARRRRRSS